MKKILLLNITFLILCISFVSADVFVNEFLPNGDEWIELYNNGTTAVNLTGWTINDTLVSPSVIVTISDNTFIQPDNHLIFYVSSELNNSGDTIKLIDNIGVVIDEYIYSSDPGINVSTGRIHDGFAEWINFTIPTPNAANNRLPADIISNQTITEDIAGSFNISDDITDPDNDTLTFTIVDENVSEVDCNIINDTNVTLTPVADWNGVANCTVRVNDTYGTVDKSFNIIVNAVNDTPYFTTTPILTAIAAIKYYYDAERK